MSVVSFLSNLTIWSYNKTRFQQICQPWPSFLWIWAGCPLLNYASQSVLPSLGFWLACPIIMHSAAPGNVPKAQIWRYQYMERNILSNFFLNFHFELLPEIGLWAYREQRSMVKKTLLLMMIVSGMASWQPMGWYSSWNLKWFCE